MRLSLVIATHNEEETIKECITSCRGIVDEVIVVDGSSTDKTADIAKQLGARVVVVDNPSMFHINKQKAIDMASCDWILQLDADERVSPALGREIRKIIIMSDKEIVNYQNNLLDKALFQKHEDMLFHNQQLITNNQEPKLLVRKYNAFFIPRLNYFLGVYLRYGGVYPDGVIRLFCRGKAHLPCKSVHEIMEVDGRIGWLQNPLLHYDSPTFKRYLERNSRYIDYLISDIKSQMSNKNLLQKIIITVNWILVKPIWWFLMTTFRHKGILDGWQGVVFSFFSALRFPRAYLRYMFRKS